MPAGAQAPFQRVDLEPDAVKHRARGRKTGSALRGSLDARRTDVGGSLEGDFDPQPSPDGSELAFWSNRPGRRLFVSDADGSHQRRMRLPVDAPGTRMR
jgi:hypothetical protein